MASPPPGGLVFQFPEIPESVNNLYFQKGGRRVLSATGRRYKTAFLAARGGVDDLQFLSFVPDHTAPYELHLWFLVPFESLYNNTYGHDARVKSPFKDMDTSNMVKLAEDAIAELLGLRDRNNFTVCAHKREAYDGKARLVAILKPLTLGEDPYEPPG